MISINQAMETKTLDPTIKINESTIFWERFLLGYEANSFMGFKSF